MLYYGLIIFKLRRFNKIEDEKMNYKENDIQVSNTILKLDRLMLVTYCIVFGIYNAGYCMTYFTWYFFSVLLNSIWEIFK